MALFPGVWQTFSPWPSLTCTGRKVPVCVFSSVTCLFFLCHPPTITLPSQEDMEGVAGQGGHWPTGSHSEEGSLSCPGAMRTICPGWSFSTVSAPRWVVSGLSSFFLLFVVSSNKQQTVKKMTWLLRSVLLRHWGWRPTWGHGARGFCSHVLLSMRLRIFSPVLAGN